MNKEDYISLIKVADTLDRMDETLIKLTGFGHCEGDFRDLDIVYEVLQRHSIYKSEEDLDNKFFVILTDREKRAEERADLLMN